MSHVAFVIPGVDRVGGAERQVLLLATGLRRRGWQVSLVALTGDGGEAARGLMDAGVEFVSLHMRKGVVDPRGWMRVCRWLAAHRPDVLHAHLPHATWIARGSRLLMPVRVVVDTMHTAAEVPAARRMAYRLSAGLSDRVTAVSEAVAARCGEDGIASAERAVVMPNGIDTEVWKPDERARDFVRAELGLRDEFLWCSVGRLEPVKDHALLLRAFAMLPKRAALAIAGSGALEGSLRELARDLAIAERVHFVGFQPDVRRWVQAADGVVLTSRWEGLPLNLLEAGACAVPCVATDVAGVRDVVEDGATGLLAEARSPDAVAAQMRRLMEMPREERAGMGERARRRVVDRFGLERVLDGWERLYGELLAANPRARRFAIRLRQGGLSVAEGAD